LFSGDLSSATDYCPFEVAEAIVEGMADGLDWSPELIEVAHKMTQSQAFQRDLDLPWDPEWEYTERGILLGTGFSWTLLSIYNAFAAWRARGRVTNDHSFAVCGDDIIALWTKQEVENYISIMEQLQLKVNRQKSFFGSWGVFCEKLVQITQCKIIADDSVEWNKAEFIPIWKAAIRNTLCYKEASFARHRFSKGNIRVVRENLNGCLRRAQSKFMRAMVRCGLEKLHRSGDVPGPVGIGGNGSPANKGTLPLIAAAVNKGAVSMNTDAKRRECREFKNGLFERLTEEKGPKVLRSEVDVALSVAFNNRQCERGHATSDVKPLPQKALAGKTRKRVEAGKLLLNLTGKDILSKVPCAIRHKARVFRHIWGRTLNSLGGRMDESKIVTRFVRFLAKWVLRRPDSQVNADQLTQLYTDEQLYVTKYNDGSEKIFRKFSPK
jgi:hypothetical protein